MNIQWLNELGGIYGFVIELPHEAGELVCNLVTQKQAALLGIRQTLSISLVFFQKNRYSRLFIVEEPHLIDLANGLLETHVAAPLVDALMEQTEYPDLAEQLTELLSIDPA